MLQSQFIEAHLETDCPVFYDDDFVADVLPIMQRQHVSCAPVLSGGKPERLVTLPDLLAAEQTTDSDTLRLKELPLPQASGVEAGEHLFDIFRRLPHFPCDVVPVADDKGMFAGVIDKQQVIEQVARIFHVGDDSLTLELEVPKSGVKLSEIIALLERNDATILSFGMYTATSDNHESIILSFRLQTHDFFRLVQNLEHYGYQVHYTSQMFNAEDEVLREKAREILYLIDL
jgi:acetoin utilization protein AcuB